VGIILAEPWNDNFTMSGLEWWLLPLSEGRQMQNRAGFNPPGLLSAENLASPSGL